MLVPIRESYWLPHTGADPAINRRKDRRSDGFFSKIVLSVLLALGLYAQARAETGQEYAAQASAQVIGRRVPPLVLTTIDGDRIDLGALRGKKAVYLKFWATWCSPCREQMPHFEHVQQQSGDDLQVIAINIGFDDTVEQIKALRKEFGLAMPVVRDDDGKLGEVFGLRVTPQHVIIDKQGRIAYVGHLVDAKLETALADARHGDAAHVAVQDAASDKTASDDVSRLTVQTIDGVVVPLADPDHARKTTLFFFSPWCEGYFAKTRPESSAQCRAMRERLSAIGGEERQREIGIAFGVWTSDDDVKKFRERNHVAVPLALDSSGDMFRRFGVHNVPVVVELDAQGRVEGRH
jgi:peroxiredoxin